MVQTGPNKRDGVGAWSPDGSKLLLMSNANGGDDLFLSNADGSDNHAIDQTTNEGQGSPEFSPLGTKIAFVWPTTGPDDREIAVMNADGSNFRQLTDTPAVSEGLFTFHGKGYLPGNWSPDEQHIAYSRGSEVWVLDVDAPPNTSRKVSGSLSCSGAVWSPADNVLYLVSMGDLYVYTTTSDWSGAPVRVTTNAGSTRSVQISPDGSKAVFSNYTDNGDIWLCDVSATSTFPNAPLTQLTSGTVADSCPAWLDNDTVSFVRDPGQEDIYTLDLTDNTLRNVTNASHSVFFLGWTPDITTP
jgi:Tol biopolymer transport system component